MDNPKGLVKVDDFIRWQSGVIPEKFIEPQTNIYVSNDRFIIVSNFPGVFKENIRIEISDNELTILGRMPAYFEIDKCDFYIKEFNLGVYQRKFVLSDSIDVANVFAQYENGQLTIILPKHKKQEKQEIFIR
jgi:HSP20 family protein